MSCHGCARSFGFLTKEYGCQKCGFSFCSKCLVNKVCKGCSIKATSSAPPSIQPTPVDLQKKLEKLEVPKKSPITVYTAESQRLANLKRGLSTEDQELVNRLSKLRSEVSEIKNIPSQDEIEERLAKLKGVDPKVLKQPALNLVTVQKSNVDSATSLINQISEEVAIDRQSDLPQHGETNIPSASAEQEEDDLEALLRKEAAIVEAEAKLALENLKKDEEIRERLKKLRLDRDSRQAEETTAPTATDDADVDEVLDSEDEEAQVRSIIDRALAEQALGGLDKTDNDVDVANDDELPWCELCNEDAHLRCLDCDGDLYCRRCWKETHREPDLKRHHIKEYRT